ncbi:MAG TPA: DUF3237 family protein [Vicinamibacterales bacterium]|nr:DUF3237 family protein [Vicinamibacterales bacterium]
MRIMRVTCVVSAFLLLVFAAALPVAGQSARVLVPHSSWTCGMPDGIPAPEGAPLVFEAHLTLAAIHNLGTTPYGARQVAVVQDGTFSGPRVSGMVAAGALDLQLTLSNGVVELEQIFVLQTADRKYIYLRAAGTGANAGDVRIVPDFEAPASSDFAWLNTGRYVARRVIDTSARTMTLRVYDVSEVTPPTAATNVTRIEKPAGMPAQPWDYRTAAPGEIPGGQLIVETVTLSPSQPVGASKRGNRNIIPITGGDLTGRFAGKVLFGGADYQNLSAPATIDARYLWQADNGDIILVRNAGPIGSLVPTFEVRTDSPYAWLNTGRFLSANPAVKPGGVGITMYESTR